MPKVTWGRDVSPEIKRMEWIEAFSDSFENKRRRKKQSYTNIADMMQITRQTLWSKLKTGDFSLDEFCQIADCMNFTDAEIINLLRMRMK